SYAAALCAIELPQRLGPSFLLAELSSRRSCCDLVCNVEDQARYQTRAVNDALKVPVLLAHRKPIGIFGLHLLQDLAFVVIGLYRVACRYEPRQLCELLPVPSTDERRKARERQPAARTFKECHELLSIHNSEECSIGIKKHHETEKRVFGQRFQVLL